jgi:hypothetical protein
MTNDIEFETVQDEQLVLNNCVFAYLADQEDTVLNNCVAAYLG